MQPVLQKILVVGGNGFIGSAVCKAALARGMEVTSISTSGRPYRTPAGHTPAWTSKVNWQKADALHPETYAQILPRVNGVVHTLGTLLEDGRYKKALSESDVGALVSGFVSGLLDSGNPLEKGGERGQGTYEVLNRDSALRMCETFMSTPADPDVESISPRPFVYISAEDIFRPFISARYIETKREAELGIAEMMLNRRNDYRGVYIRPSLVYHPHLRPLTTPLAALLDLSATIHSKIPPDIPFPTPSRVLRSLGSAFPPSSDSSSSPLDSIANALTIPPIHVEHVAEAVCIAVGNPGVEGSIGVRGMRELIGWSEGGSGTA